MSFDVAAPARRIIGPQPGRQTMFLSSRADLTLYGGSAGSGKSYALLLEGTRHTANKGFRGIYFRRTSPELRAPGGLWDTSRQLYGLIGGRAREAHLEWIFPSGALLKFSHLEHESDIYAHQGAQYAFIGFDEVNHFSKKQFWYLVSRLRSTCGMKPYLRATCNPDPDSWVAAFIAWFIDQETGIPIAERVGVLRWFARDGDEFVWGSSPEEVREKASHLFVGPDGEALRLEDVVMSMTFIAARLSDNKKLLEKDPSYKARLNALSWIDRMRLLEGNWKVREKAGTIFRAEWFKEKFVDERAPAGARRIRYWDLAASAKKGADWTAGVLVAVLDGRFWIEDIRITRGRPAEVEKLVRWVAEMDGKSIDVWLEQEAVGSAGITVTDHYQRNVLAGWPVYGNAVRGEGTKVERAKPASAACEAGNVSLVRGPHIEKFIEQAEAFPTRGVHDDIVDAFVGGFNKLNDPGEFSFATVRR